jgi:predicted ArsR family transcriptional regulator
MTRTLSDRAGAVSRAMKARADYLLCILREMDRAGMADVDEVLKRAIYNVGKLWAQGLGKVATPEEFHDALFSPDLREILGVSSTPRGSGVLEIRFEACPLVERWREVHCTDAEVERLCEIARQVDYGTIESLGMTVEMEERLGCCDSRCVLVVKKDSPTGAKG